MELRQTEQFSVKIYSFSALILIAALISTLLHEFGHCLFYWIQGIPAAMSFTKEFPLRDITARQYGIGSFGGPLLNIIQIVFAYWFFVRYKDNYKLRMISSAFIIANAFYFILRSLLAVLKGEGGGELGDAAKLFGVNYLWVVGLFFIITVIFLYLWIKRGGIKLSIKKGLYFFAMFIVYFIFLVILTTIDRPLFWDKFQPINIDDGRIYNEHIWKK